VITISPRTEHIAAHVTPEAKAEMQRVARDANKSVSLLISELIDRFLEELRRK
jgi:hypothetical protein